MQTLVQLASQVGRKVAIRTTDGFRAIVDLHDVRQSYGAVQVNVSQGEGFTATRARWIDASKVIDAAVDAPEIVNGVPIYLDAPTMPSRYARI
jgi:hypothetical protein